MMSQVAVEATTIKFVLTNVCLTQMVLRLKDKLICAKSVYNTRPNGQPERRNMDSSTHLDYKFQLITMI